jgi:superfamily I DNA/RNA helicase
MLLKRNLEISDAEWVGTHDGETAIAIGNGISLQDVPSDLLEKYVTFGANHIYLMQFQPTYFVCVDTICLQKYADKMVEVAKEAKIAFLNDDYLEDNELYKLENAYLCNEDTVRFPGEYWWTGGTVTYMTLKIAYAMGFSNVLLVGCDRDSEWDHFSDDYPKGSCKEPEYWGQQAYHFGIARLVHDDADRRIINL